MRFVTRLVLGLFGVIALLLILSIVFGIALPVLPLLILLALGQAMVSLFTWHSDFDGKIVRGRLLEQSGFLSKCGFEVVELPADAQATPFAVNNMDKHWVPEGALVADWQPTPGQDFIPWPSDDKIGDTCDMSAETVARLAEAFHSEGGWVMNHHTHLYQSFLYSAPAHIAAYVIVDR